MTNRLRVAVLASGRGSNLQSIVDATTRPEFPAAEIEEKLMIQPLFCARINTHAGLFTQKAPRKCTLITASHSSMLILNTMRSRKIPATCTRMSSLPYASIAVWIIFWPPSGVATES